MFDQALSNSCFLCYLEFAHMLGKIFCGVPAAARVSAPSILLGAGFSTYTSTCVRSKRGEYFPALPAIAFAAHV
ncbi:hypothetical protein XENTR_v10024461 [Xenopus tropicalis]|nr:hypothetical protein XENTR_v10024461 [Xenopus tropicalis]